MPQISASFSLLTTSRAVCYRMIDWKDLELLNEKRLKSLEFLGLLVPVQNPASCIKMFTSCGGRKTMSDTLPHKKTFSGAYFFCQCILYRSGYWHLRADQRNWQTFRQCEHELLLFSDRTGRSQVTLC